jgi:hypothetical protein
MVIVGEHPFQRSCTFVSLLKNNWKVVWVHGITPFFESEDKSVSLSVYTHPLDPENELQTLHAFFEAEVTGRTDEKDVVNYTFIKDNWYVVSGTNFKGFEFYTKLWRYNDHWVTLNFAYPASKRKVYEPMLLDFFETSPPTCRGHGITE